MMLTVRCPHCKNPMKYSSLKPVDRESRKKCVYCPKSFLVHQNIISGV